ncbi:MAG: hypothetical protein DCC55_18370 [Chloroflexi bacterium]|nr:MAG: hypothetical protein DCC55_18370 [Chloroflexota bacterium]
MPTLHIQLLHHTIRTRAPLEYELIAYFVANQPLPLRGAETPPWEYTTVEAALVQAAALPANFDCFSGLIVEHPLIHIHGHCALLRQRIRRL